MSVGAVVVDGGVVEVVVVLLVVPEPLPVDPVVEVGVVVVEAEPVPVDAVPGAVVVVVAGGATKGAVSPVMVAALVDGVAARLVHFRAWFQLCSAVAAAVPVRGWGSPARMVAGRNVDAVT